MGEGIQPSKKLITRDYKVKEFNKIDAGTVGDIYYTQSADGKNKFTHLLCLYLPAPPQYALSERIRIIL